jgi:hypothetical protein
MIVLRLLRILLVRRLHSLPHHRRVLHVPPLGAPSEPFRSILECQVVH